MAENENGALPELEADALDARLARLVDPTPARRIESEGKGWEYPTSSSVANLRDGIRYEAAMDLV